MKSFKVYTEAKLSTSEKLNRNLKKGGFDADASLARIEAIRKKNAQPQPKEPIKEDGAGGIGAAPANSVGGIAGSGDSRLPANQREPGVSKKRNPILKGMFTRKPPKV